VKHGSVPKQANVYANACVIAACGPTKSKADDGVVFYHLDLTALVFREEMVFVIDGVPPMRERI
jgi:hypothetical protein